MVAFHQRIGLHLESSVLADEFEFGFMESIETQFEEITVTEAEGASEQAADFSVDAFHFCAGEPGLVIAKDPLGMAKEGLRHGVKLPDAAGFCLGNTIGAGISRPQEFVFLVSQSSPSSFLEQVGTLQRLH